MTSAAIFNSNSDNLSAAKNSSAFSTDNPQTSMMESPGIFIFDRLDLNCVTKPSPPSVTARISGFKRLPPQASQNCGAM